MRPKIPAVLTALALVLALAPAAAAHDDPYECSGNFAQEDSPSWEQNGMTCLFFAGGPYLNLEAGFNADPEKDPDAAVDIHGAILLQIGPLIFTLAECYGEGSGTTRCTDEEGVQTMPVLPPNVQLQCFADTHFGAGHSVSADDGFHAFNGGADPEKPGGYVRCWSG